MEIDLTCSEDMDAILRVLFEESDSRDASYAEGVHGEPQIKPRVGDQYQAEIPDLQPAHVSSDSGQERNERKEETETEARRRKTVLGLPCHQNLRIKRKNRSRPALYGRPLPGGSFGEAWEDVELARFLVALYTIGKDLNAVQRMVESKSMKEIHDFYHGSFSRSREYKRWSEGRSLTSKKSVQGRNLLTGWRQQELLSRILHHVSDERKAGLVEASKAFREEKVSLEEYVFTLKDTVGVDRLVEAFQIGKRRKDLTSAAMEPPRTNRSVPADCKELWGKSWFALSSSEIISLLTGGFRLSKTRSSDLFWEAVWPRLLARGWHSEQPKDHPRNYLVYLSPGIKSFSKRRLVKGEDYFDSISDLLSKVALEPEFLELDMEAMKGNVETIGNGNDLGSKEEEAGEFQGKKQRLGTKRSSVNKILDGVKLTIIDTSMSTASKIYEVRDFSSFLAGNGSGSTISCFPDQSGTQTAKQLEIAARKRAETYVYGDGSLDAGKSDTGGKIGSQVKTCYIDLADEEPTIGAETGLGETKLKGKEPFVIPQEYSGRRVDIDLNLPPVPDLNLPPVPLDFEEGKPKNIAKGVQNVKSSLADQSTIEVEMSIGEASTDQQASRRCGARNRPLSAKALEAIAFGVVGRPRMKRSNPESSSSNSSAKFARVHHSLTVHTSESGNGINDAPNPNET